MGAPIRSVDFPRIRSRRIPANLPADEAYALDKRANQTVDFAVDATLVLDPGEVLIAAYAWSSVPAVLVIASCRFVELGIMVNVLGGVDKTRYVINLVGETIKGRVLHWPLYVDVFGTGVSAAAPDASWPRYAYLEDLAGTTIYPAYEDLFGDPLSVPL